MGRFKKEVDPIARVPVKKYKKAKPGNNRLKGANYERELAQDFRELGFKFCKTSRQASRLLDDCKVDLYGLPFNLQAKNVRANIDYNLIFDSMKKLLSENIPEREFMLNAIFHKRMGKEFVVMSKDDFYKMIRTLNDNKLL